MRQGKPRPDTGLLISRHFIFQIYSCRDGLTQAIFYGLRLIQ